MLTEQRRADHVDRGVFEPHGTSRQGELAAHRMVDS
jgi:hypothetical protein